MLDLIDRQIRLPFVDREDRAMLRSNPSARSMPGDGREHMLYHMFPPSRPSLGCNAVNLLNWCEAPTEAEDTDSGLPVGHMSVFIVRGSIGRALFRKNSGFVLRGLAATLRAIASPG